MLRQLKLPELGIEFLFDHLSDVYELKRGVLNGYIRHPQIVWAKPTI
jgi:hypothetical protein